VDRRRSTSDGERKRRRRRRERERGRRERERGREGDGLGLLHLRFLPMLRFFSSFVTRSTVPSAGRPIFISRYQARKLQSRPIEHNMNIQ